ncbi:MAG: hypothetical protein ACK5TM_00385 [Methylobacterium sp.]|jgi:hypothetical protein|nr:hypothetical protein [Hyphomonadaceae bacterium]
MSLAQTLLNSLDYTRDLHAGGTHKRRAELWQLLSPNERLQVSKEVLTNGPWYLRQYIKNHHLPFDVEDIFPFVLGAFSEWSKYRLCPLCPTDLLTPRPSAEVELRSLEAMQRAFADPAQTLMFSFFGASQNLKTVMHAMRVQATLPPRQLALAQWTYLQDACGIYRAIADDEDEYDRSIHQRYLAALHGDGGARLDFQVVADHGDSFTRMWPEICRKIEYHYVPNFEEAWASVVGEEIQVAASDVGPMAEYARALLQGGGGRGGGWATSR